MTDIKEAQKIPLSEQVKQAAKTQVDNERFEAAKNRLVQLYRKRADAEKIMQNIDNEIADYELELNGK